MLCQRLFEINEDMVQILLMLEVLFNQVTISVLTGSYCESDNPKYR